MAEKNKLLLKLFLNMLYISAFTFGGGFVIVTLMKKRFVDKYGWIDEKEMLDITSAAQSTPGAIAVNAAVIVGKKLGGAAGILSVVLGTVIPPVAIISIISLFYGAFADNTYVSLLLKGMSAGVAAVILDVVCSLCTDFVKNKKIFDICIILLSFVLVFFLDVNVIIIIAAAVIMGTAGVIMKKRKDGGK